MEGRSFLFVGTTVQRERHTEVTGELWLFPRQVERRGCVSVVHGNYFQGQEVRQT